MKFTIEMVNEYLTIVNDENPIHRSIVPCLLYTSDAADE